VGNLAVHKEVSRVSVRTDIRDTQYATGDYLVESLEALRIKYDLPLKQALSFIATRKTDSVSLGKESPYLRFHANLIRNVVHISIQELSRDVKFQLPLSSLVSLSLG
jgi:hypothetical protein